MDRNVWSFVNYVLVFILIVLAVVIGAIYISDAAPGQSGDQVVQEEKQLETDDEDQSKSLIKKQQMMVEEEKEVSVDKQDKEEEKEDDSEKIDEDDETDSDEEADDVDDKDSSDSDEDGDDEKTGEVKTLTGVLEEAEEDNEYGGNYKIKLEGNTEYTYLWLGEQMVGGSLIGETVEFEVEYQDDGTFIILDGPKPV